MRRIDVIRVAQVKVRPARGDPAANHALLMDVLREIEAEPVDVVVTPECCLDGYVAANDAVSAPDLRGYAIDPETSPYAREVADWARRRGAWFVHGVSRLVGDGVRNSALIYNRSGAPAGVYDKVHLQMHDLKFRPGDRLPVFESDFGPFGVMICADRRWPETVRTLALRGARVIFNPSCGMAGEFNTMIMRTRSYESETCIAFTHPAMALVTGPEGEVLREEADDSVRWTVTEIGLSRVDRARAGPSAHLRDRMPELYER